MTTNEVGIYTVESVKALEAERDRLVLKLEKIRPFIEEIWQSHRDPNDPDYNSCEDDECAWCQETREALSDDGSS